MAGASVVKPSDLEAYSQSHCEYARRRRLPASAAAPVGVAMRALHTAATIGSERDQFHRLGRDVQTLSNRRSDSLVDLEDARRAAGAH